MSSTRSLPRARAWLRVVALLLAVLAPVVPAEATTVPPVAAAETVEYDSLDTAVRPTGTGTHRTLPPPPRSVPCPAPEPGVPQGRALPAPPATISALRTVVLRC
ncbi:hypothetical protein [Streptomyces aurantiogriseus]|uniref:Secreted protein n=1 Tax=Streptomyces aurantiogriseus TaxID=66870 RepID=A0A918F0M7_9ACTN|nr:hypothetical protein [Streptomyces aurantiogriseus]GGQ94104.1 hypothetical protein GCM10010251_06160 [Streptomyces aurantiogriseus]